MHSIHILKVSVKKKIKITLLRAIPTMAFNSSHLTFSLTYLSGIAPGMSSDILSGISSDILHGILSGIPSSMSSDIQSGISSGILSVISVDILSVISSDILSGILSGIPSSMSSDIQSGISSGILPVISFDILSGISSDILSGISSDILPDILSGILFGILYGFVCGRWGLVEVRRGPRRAESRRLRTRRRSRASDIKSNNPHLAGEEQCYHIIADGILSSGKLLHNYGTSPCFSWLCQGTVHGSFSS